MSKEFEPIVLENPEFEKRQKYNTNWNFSHVHPINIPIIKGHNQRLLHVRNIQTISPSTQTLIEEIKYVASKKDQLIYRETPIFIAILTLVVNKDSKTDVTDEPNDFYKRIVSSSIKPSTETLMV